MENIDESDGWAMYLEWIMLRFSKVAWQKNPVDEKPPGTELLRLSSVRLNPHGARNYMISHKIGING